AASRLSLRGPEVAVRRRRQIIGRRRKTIGDPSEARPRQRRPTGVQSELGEATRPRISGVKTMPRSVPLVVVALVVGAASGSASARPPHSDGSVPVVIRVPIGDLDLSREAGADAPLKRVAAAASRACYGPPALGVQMPEIARAYRACKAQALERAVAQVDSPM